MKIFRIWEAQWALNRINKHVPTSRHFKLKLKNNKENNKDNETIYKMKNRYSHNKNPEQWNSPFKILKKKTVNLEFHTQFKYK